MHASPRIGKEFGTPGRASIVVRSMGREELNDALRSIAAQTWPDVEAVVVAASGPTHPQPPARCGRHPVRFVPGAARLARPAAANAGLQVATGEFVGFLDDDDVFLPQHVETLVDALRAAPASPAAYSIAREVDASGALVRRRGVPFSRLLLHQVCYLIPDALLLRREALAQCRFDERFELCEDWDFFLQLAELGDLAFVPVETVVYRGFLGTSGTREVADASSQRLRHFAAMLATKWEARGRLVAAAIDDAAERVVELFRAGRHQEAEAAADRVLAAYPYEVAALNVKGTLLALRGDVGAALQSFRIAAKEAPDDAASRFNLAQALERTRQPDEALAEYERVLALAPDHAGAAARKAALQRQ
jgi:tetratricopeptide (TPR) repeat protein